MMSINTVVGVLACLVCLLTVTSFALLIRVQALHERCIDILVCAYDWLEKARQKEGQKGTEHDGTD